MLNTLHIQTLPDIQHRYTDADRAQFEKLIAALRHLHDPRLCNDLIRRTLTDRQQERFYEFCDDIRKKQAFRQACRDCHDALTEHANYLTENLAFNRKPEGENTEAILNGLLERREGVFRMYVRHIFDDISQGVEQRSSRKSKP